ncbi:hypothetical protein HKX42_00135 [Salinisphaera sp. USBA-960]|nr:hypothetical protein [Salifodinibacter halophilus]NNC25299.1 hypothetical protein [Salifodinibacter halophilus]
MAIAMQPGYAAGFSSLFGRIQKEAGDTLTLPEGMANIGGNGHGFLLSKQTGFDPLADNDGTITEADVGAMLGTDVYIYAVTPTSGGYADWIASKNSTVPMGHDTNDSRKIGGFHIGRVRPMEKRYDASFEPAVHIVPNSCWDLQHRPKCDPSGMVEIIPSVLWADIYLNSEGAGTWPENVPVSRYDATPIKDDSYARADFHQLIANAGKRVPSVPEFLRYAEGCPQGADSNNDTAWSDDSNSGPTSTGTVAKALSQYNIVDAAGNLWDWLDAHYDAARTTSNSRGFRDDVVDVGKDSDKSRGKTHTFNDAGNSGRVEGNEGQSGWRSFGGGGRFDDGVRCGARCLDSTPNPWSSNGDVGLRGVCDAL